MTPFTPPGPGLMKRGLYWRISGSANPRFLLRDGFVKSGRWDDPPWPPLLKGGKGKAQQTPKEGGASWVASFQLATLAPLCEAGDGRAGLSWGRGASSGSLAGDALHPALQGGVKDGRGFLRRLFSRKAHKIGVFIHVGRCIRSNVKKISDPLVDGIAKSGKLVAYYRRSKSIADTGVGAMGTHTSQDPISSIYLRSRLIMKALGSRDRGPGSQSHLNRKSH